MLDYHSIQCSVFLLPPPPPDFILLFSNLTINSKYHHALRVYVSPSAACAAPLRSNYGSVLLWLFAGAHRARDREATRSGADAMQGPSVGEPVSLMSLITRWE